MNTDKNKTRPKSYNPIEEYHWLLLFKASGLSIREFCRQNPTAPSIATFSRLLYRDKMGMGFEPAYCSALRQDEIARAIFLLDSYVKDRLKSMAQFSRLVVSATDEEVHKAGSLTLLRPWVRPFDPKRDRRNVQHIPRSLYKQLCRLIREAEKGGFKLSNLAKVALRECYLSCGCGSQFTGLCWSMDEYEVPEHVIEWIDTPIKKGTRVIVVCVESPHRQLLAVTLIQGQPLLSDYCKALWLAMQNAQKLTDLPAYRPAILITDNCKAAVEGTGFVNFCNGLGIVHMPAIKAVPHAKIAVESLNQVLQSTTSVAFYDVQYRFDEEGEVRLFCTAEKYLEALVDYARRFNHGYPLTGDSSRAEVAMRIFDWFILPLDTDTLPPPLPYIEETVTVCNRVVTTKDGARFLLESRIPDGTKFLALRHVLDEHLMIDTDLHTYHAYPITDGGPTTCLI